MAEPRRVPSFCAPDETVDNLIDDIETFWRECQDLMENEGIPRSNPIVHKPKLIIEYEIDNRTRRRVRSVPSWIIDVIGDPEAKPEDRQKGIDRLRRYIDDELTIGWRDLENPKATIKFLCTPKTPNRPKFPYKEGESDPIYLVPSTPLELTDPAQNPVVVTPR